MPSLVIPGRARGASERPDRQRPERPDGQRPASWRARERAADALRRVPAWSITAACGLAYVLAGAAQRGSRGGGVSQRTVRTGGLYALGQRLVRRPPPPRLLGAGAGARRVDRGAAAGGALDGRRHRAVRAADRRPVRRAGDARGVALVCRRRIGVAAGQPRPVQPRPRARAGLPARRAPPAPRPRARAGARELARKPRRRRVPGARAARPGTHDARARAGRMGARAERRGAVADRAAAARLPRRRDTAVRWLLLLAGVRGRAR